MCHDASQHLLKKFSAMAAGVVHRRMHRRVFNVGAFAFEAVALECNEFHQQIGEMIGASTLNFLWHLAKLMKKRIAVALRRS